MLSTYCTLQYIVFCPAYDAVFLFFLQPQSTLEAQIRDAEKAVMDNFEFLRSEGKASSLYGGSYVY